jgi:hypothetical protein
VRPHRLAVRLGHPQDHGDQDEAGERDHNRPPWLNEMLAMLAVGWLGLSLCCRSSSATTASPDFNDPGIGRRRGTGAVSAGGREFLDFRGHLVVFGNTIVVEVGPGASATISVSRVLPGWVVVRANGVRPGGAAGGCEGRGVTVTGFRRGR